MRNIALVSAIAIYCATAASADFVGWNFQIIQLGNGHVIMNVYAKFTNAGDRVVNVYDTNISCTNAGGFFQNAANPFWRPSTQSGVTSDDSFVTIDTNPNGNGVASGTITAGDPNFVNFDDLNGSTDFSVIESAGNGAGWYNSHPETQWGYADGGQLQVQLAHFVLTNISSSHQDFVTWDVKMTVTLDGQTGSVSGVGAGSINFYFLPAPGALALLGIAGLAGRRSRR